MRLYGTIVFFHLLFIGFLFTVHSSSNSKKKSPAISEKVTYYKEKPKPPVAMVTPPKKTKAPVYPSKKEEKKSVKSPLPNKKSIPKKNEPSHGSSNKKKKGEIAQALKSMANTLESSSATPSKASVCQLSSIQTLSLSSEQMEDSSFEQQLIQFLKSHLELPKSGSATIVFTLSKEGLVKQFKVLNCDQERNRLYLSEEVPALLFPSNNTQREYQIKIHSSS